MNHGELDVMDCKILDVIRHRARATFSEIGEEVGLSRVAVKNRMEIMEQTGIIQGYETKIRQAKGPNSVQFVVDVETTTDHYQKVADMLGMDSFFRQVYITTGDCRLHAIGFAPNTKTLEQHVKHLYRQTKGIRKMSVHLLIDTLKDVDGGVEYVQCEKTEHLEG